MSEGAGCRQKQPTEPQLGICDVRPAAATRRCFSIASQARLIKDVQFNFITSQQHILQLVTIAEWTFPMRVLCMGVSACVCTGACSVQPTGHSSLAALKR